MSLPLDQSSVSTPYVAMKNPRGDLVYVKRSSLDFGAYMTKVDQMVPSGTTSINTAGTSFVEFQIDGCSVHRVDQLVFSVTCTNTDAVVGHNLIPVPLQFQLNNVQFWVNNQLANTVISQDLFLADVTGDYGLVQSKAHAAGFTVNATTGAFTQGSNDLIAPSGTKVYTLTIPSFISQIFMATLRVNSLRVRFTFNSGANLVNSTTVASWTALSYSNPVLYLLGRKYNDDVAGALIKQYQQAPHISRCILRANQVTTQSTTSGSYAQILLGSINGTFCNLYIVSNDQAGNPEDQYLSYQAISTLSIQNPSGDAIWVNDVPSSLFRDAIMPLKGGRSLVDVSNHIYMWPLARFPFQNCLGGGDGYPSNGQRNSGGIFFDGRHRLQAKAAVTGTSTFTISGWYYGCVRQGVQGDLTVSAAVSNQ